MNKLSCFVIVCLYWCAFPAWAESLGEVRQLSRESRVHFEQPCPDDQQLGYFDLSVGKSGDLIFHSRCSESTLIESRLLKSKGTLPAHQFPRVLEAVTSRRGLSITSSVGPLHHTLQLRGDADSPCVQVTASVNTENPFPAYLSTKTNNWRSRIQYMIDSACTVMSIKAGNWVATLPVDRAEMFSMYGVEFRVEALPPQSAISDSIEIEQGAVSSPQTDEVLPLSRQGQVQFFQPCRAPSSLSFSQIRIDADNLIFEVRCSFQGKGRWRLVKYPNKLIQTGQLLILNSTGTLNVTDRAELNVRESIAAFAERILLKRMDGLNCVQIVAESNETNSYHPGLLQELSDWRESVGYSIDSACRVLAINTGNLIAVMSTNSPEYFSIYGIQFTTKPIVEDVNSSL